MEVESLLTLRLSARRLIWKIRTLWRISDFVAHRIFMLPECHCLEINQTSDSYAILQSVSDSNKIESVG